MFFFVPCVHEHASLSYPTPSWLFPSLPEDPFPSFGSFKVPWSRLFLGSLRALLIKVRPSFLYFFFFSTTQGLTIHELGFPFNHFKWVLAHELDFSYLWGPIRFGFQYLQYFGPQHLAPWVHGLPVAHMWVNRILIPLGFFFCSLLLWVDRLFVFSKILSLPIRGSLSSALFSEILIPCIPLSL